MDEVELAQESQARRTAGVTLAIFVFLLTEVIFIGRYDNGFVLGLHPAALAGMLVGWLAHQSLWFGIALGVVLNS
jgi:hypothetical protein